jgi:hypothetical protein
LRRLKAEEKNWNKSVTAVEQCLEGPVNEAVIQEFIEQEALAQQQVEAARAKLEDFEAELPRSE